MFLCGYMAAYGQVDRSNVRRGNQNYKKGEYQEAEINYKKA